LTTQEVDTDCFWLWLFF